MKKLLVVMILSSLIFSGCSNSSESLKQSESVQSSEETTGQEKADSELSQSEWMEQHADEMEDGYEVVDAIDIDSGDTKLEYTSSERYKLESGEEILLVNFTFSVKTQI